jgi:hypothetical protein
MIKTFLNLIPHLSPVKSSFLNLGSKHWYMVLFGSSVNPGLRMMKWSHEPFIRLGFEFCIQKREPFSFVICKIGIAPTSYVCIKYKSNVGKTAAPSYGQVFKKFLHVLSGWDAYIPKLRAGKNVWFQWSKPNLDENWEATCSSSLSRPRSWAPPPNQISLPSPFTSQLFGYIRQHSLHWAHKNELGKCEYCCLSTGSAMAPAA